MHLYGFKASISVCSCLSNFPSPSCCDYPCHIDIVSQYLQTVLSSIKQFWFLPCLFLFYNFNQVILFSISWYLDIDTFFPVISIFLGTWRLSSALSAQSLTAHVPVPAASSSYSTQQLAGKKCGKYMQLQMASVEGFVYFYLLILSPLNSPLHCVY